MIRFRQFMPRDLPHLTAGKVQLAVTVILAVLPGSLVDGQIPLSELVEGSRTIKVSQTAAEASSRSVFETGPPQRLYQSGALPVNATQVNRDAVAKVAEPAKCLVLITLDGLRREELFGGADIKLMNRDAGGVRDVKAIRKRFWTADTAARRELLLPFFWKTIAGNGQLLGDPERGSSIRCTNGLFFSYPGYNELLVGRKDPAIVSNAKLANANVTVLEWLNQQTEFQGQVAAFGSWDVFPYIINEKRSGIPVNAGWEDLTVGNPEKISQLNEVASQLPRVWPNVRYDYFTQQGALHYLRHKKPRVIYIAYGETDDWAHDGRYDLYLDSANRTDRYIQQIWETMQELPEYQGQTAMLISTDHGRGNGREGWKNHSVQLPGSEFIWMAAIGKGVPSLGNRQGLTLTQSQFAATAASLLGLKYAPEGVALPVPLQSVKQ